jgi:lysophospholipase L1-like esterase
MLNNNHKNIIQKKRKNNSAKIIAKKLHLDIKEVEGFLNSTPQNKSPYWFYIVLTILPIVLLLVLEISLRIFDYGQSYKEWTSLNDKYEILHPDIANKYFSGINNIPFSTESFLLKNKPSNSFRIITLGASSGAGYPYQNSGSFTKYIRKGFQYALPTKKFEVANISMAAINSYTILDLLPGVLEKKPDLILIYLGHNEYYGALGVGSSQTIGNSRFITNLVLDLKEIKLYQLIENIIGYIKTFTNSEINSSDGTLMSKIADEKLIAFNSEIFNNGVNQFEGNLRDILSLCKDNRVPVIIGTLVSNLKDLKPFNSIEDKDNESAKYIYNVANEKYNGGNFSDADSLFRLAKDLDGLRFRAPEKFNKIIKSLAQEFNNKLVDLDSIINSKSKNGIIGDELTVDHLHPNLEGYQLIGKSFFDKILVGQYSLPIDNFINDIKIDSIVKANYNFTKYDSIIADYRVKILKNDWPFINSKNKIDRKKLIKVNTFESNVAKNVLDGKSSRIEARLILANHYFKNDDLDLYVKELLAMIEEFPTEKKNLNEKINLLIKEQKYQFVGKLLKASYDLEPDSFNTKWLGIMNMSNGELDNAESYLRQSKKFYAQDSQVLFNLAGIYYQQKNFQFAYQYVVDCLKISPNYKNANILKAKLEKILKSK